MFPFLMRRVFIYFLILAVAAADIVPTPRRGARFGALLIVPGLDKESLRSVLSTNEGAFYSAVTSGAALDDERVLGMEIATGRGVLENAHSVADSWTRNGRAVGLVTTSCVLDPMITPFAMPYTASLQEASQQVTSIAHSPRVWVGGRAANLRAMNLGRPPYCVANNTALFKKCATSPPAGGLYGMFGDPQSLFARRCMFVPADGPSAADLARAAIHELDGNDQGWFFVFYMNDMDRAGHAMSVSKRQKALRAIRDVAAVMQDTFAQKNWTDVLMTVFSPYETGGFNGSGYTSAVHAGAGGLYVRAGATAEAIEEVQGMIGPRNVAGLFSPGMAVTIDDHPLSFIIQEKTRSIENKEPRFAWIFLGSLCTVLLVAVSYAINAFSSNIKKTTKLRQTVG